MRCECSPLCQIRKELIVIMVYYEWGRCFSMRCLVLVIYTLMVLKAYCTTHWVVTEDGKIQAQVRGYGTFVLFQFFHVHSLISIRYVTVICTPFFSCFFLESTFVCTHLTLPIRNDNSRVRYHSCVIYCQKLQ